MDRDIAIVVKDSVSAGSILNYIKENLGSICEDIEIFDIYKGIQVKKGYKSVALSIKLRSIKKTLNDNEINTIMNSLIEKLNIKFSANLR